MICGHSPVCLDLLIVSLLGALSDVQKSQVAQTDAALIALGIDFDPNSADGTRRRKLANHLGVHL
jgi:hypothetical protein